MTTHRQRGDRGLRGPHLLADITTATDHTTTLINDVLRGDFTRADGTPVVLAAGPRCALYALLTYRTELRNPAYRLQMNDFVAGFKESQDTVYRWIRVLEDEGFVHRWRVNSAVDGQFEWFLAVSDAPRALATVTAANPQVRPSLQKGGDGAAPLGDVSDNPRSAHPGKSPGWGNPSMENPATATLYREITDKELPASPPVPATREQAEEAAAGSSREDQHRSLSLVRPTSPTAEEKNLAPDAEWVGWVLTLLERKPVLEAAPLRPTYNDMRLVAIRAAAAADRGWTQEQLRDRVLLVQLAGVRHLGSVWLGRLHPKNLGPPPAEGRKTQVEQGLVVPDPMRPAERPSAERRAEILAAHGLAARSGEGSV